MGVFIFEAQDVDVVGSPVAYASFRTATTVIYLANCGREKAKGLSTSPAVLSRIIKATDLNWSIGAVAKLNYLILTTMSGQSLKITLGNIIYICQATGISLLTEWIEKKQDAHDMEIERQVDELLILQENEGY